MINGRSRIGGIRCWNYFTSCCSVCDCVWGLASMDYVVTTAFVVLAVSVLTVLIATLGMIWIVFK